MLDQGVDVLVWPLGAWEQGDPAIDFDGDARPNTADAPDFAGADRVAK